MTRSYVGHDAFICETRLIHTCGIPHYTGRAVFLTHSYVGHDAVICGTWLIHTCGIPHYTGCA